MVPRMAQFEFRRDAHVWVQLTDLIRERIIDGTYRPGLPLPSEDRLAGEFGVVRNTVRRALAALREEGLIYTVPQLGSFPTAQEEDRGSG